MRARAALAAERTVGGGGRLARGRWAGDEERSGERRGRRERRRGGAGNTKQPIPRIFENKEGVATISFV